MNAPRLASGPLPCDQRLTLSSVANGLLIAAATRVINPEGTPIFPNVVKQARLIVVTSLGNSERAIWATAIECL